MTVILTKPLKHGVKTITGELIVSGVGRITLAVQDSKGSKSVKSFRLADYTVNVCQ